MRVGRYLLLACCCAGLGISTGSAGAAPGSTRAAAAPDAHTLIERVHFRRDRTRTVRNFRTRGDDAFVRYYAPVRVVRGEGHFRSVRYWAPPRYYSPALEFSVGFSPSYYSSPWWRGSGSYFRPAYYQDPRWCW